jgi:transposase
MPKLLQARAPRDEGEETTIRKLTRSRHAPADWIERAKMIALSWDGWRTTSIAAELQCHPQTVRERIVRFNREGLDGLGDRPGAGRKQRLTETERSTIIALVATPPPGRPMRQVTGTLEAEDEGTDAQWSLDALVAVARAKNIVVARSQVRRILLAEGVRWRQTHSWTTSADPEFVPKGTGSSGSTPTRQ